MRFSWLGVFKLVHVYILVRLVQRGFGLGPFSLWYMILIF